VSRLQAGAGVGRIARRAVGAAVALLVGLAPLATLAAPAAADTPPAPAPTIRLQTLTPSVAHPGDDVEVVVRVANPTTGVIKDADVDLWVDWHRIVARSDLDAWATGDEPRRSRSHQASEPLPTLTPGGSADVSLRVRVDDLALQDPVRGPVRLAVTVRSDGDELAQLHSFLLWDPTSPDDEPAADQAAPVRLSLLAAMTGPAVDPADPLSAASLVGRTGPGSPLALTRAAVDVANEVTGTRGALSLAVDPALVAIATTSDNPQVAAWSESVTGLADVTEVHPLPPYDPDLAALAHAGLGTQGLVAATSTPLPGGWTVPTTWSAPLAWPVAPPAPDLATLTAARAAGLNTAVLEAGLTPERGTPTGLATVTTDEGDVTALVADRQLSQTLVDATSPDLASTVSSAEALQRLLAETSVVSNQNGDEQPHLLAVMPRGWAPNPDSLRAALTALTTSGWVEIGPLSDLLTAPVPDVGRRSLEASAPQDGELSPDDVRRLDAARASLAELGAVAADPADIVAPLAPTLVAPLSTAWRAAADSRPEAVTAAVDAASAVRQSSLTVSATDVTLISDAGDLPILVSNALSTDANVEVVLRPDTPRLVVDSHPSAVVPANGQKRVLVPVHALGSGDVEVTVEVLTPSGAQAAAPITMQLRVQAGWETAGTWIAAVGVGLLFILGIWRTVRRGRSARRTVDAAVPDPVLHSDVERTR
jgi:hypothetical protein